MEELVGIAEIAAAFGVSSAAVTNWRNRFSDFPKPIATLKSGPVFKAEQIENWKRRRDEMSPKTISTINLKGGVAKTTTTVGLGQVLSCVHGKKVLIIDLDPQTNATTMLIGDDAWSALDEDGHTLATLFSDAVHDKSDFDLESTLQHSVGGIRDAKTLDLLPSSLQLIDLQDRLTLMPNGNYHTRNPVNILLRGVKRILGDYDYILIDCPPNLGFITLNGLRISNGYIIPTIPDVLSTYGIPQIVTRVNNFSNEIGEEVNHSVVPLGIVATKVRGQTPIHQRILNRMRAESGKLMRDSDLPYPMIFDTVFTESAAVAEAAGFDDTERTFRQRWGYGGQYATFEAFANEFIKACEGV